MMKINEDQLNKLGELADSIDNNLAASEMPLLPEFHLTQLKAFLSIASKQIKELYFNVSGENPWQ